MILGILAETKLSAGHLELELTESAAMEDSKAAIAIVEELRGFGIRISIDDFGTGHSSLGHLKHFHADNLKIDRSFVRDIADGPKDKAIVWAIANLASNLGLKTVAEGVENQEQLDYLRELGCHEAQGYFFSRPVAADEFKHLFATLSPGAHSH
jgi:EAL domain-containing protein (putative c-di-GMP-specific phosphodiesterase class I)